MNLVLNAIETMEPGVNGQKRFTIRLHDREEMVLTQIVDHGQALLKRTISSICFSRQRWMGWGRIADLPVYYLRTWWWKALGAAD